MPNYLFFILAVIIGIFIGLLTGLGLFDQSTGAWLAGLATGCIIMHVWKREV